MPLLLALGLPRRLRRELDRCKEALLRLALIRPHITFTLYDCAQRTFLLKLLKVGCLRRVPCRFDSVPPSSVLSDISHVGLWVQGRPLDHSVAQCLLGQPSVDGLAAVGPTAGGTACQVSGWAVLPPLGAPNVSQQYIYVNGHCVKAPPIAKLVDSLFQQLYKANARLAFVSGEELQSVHKASNRHAVFLLQLCCRGADCQISFDPDKVAVEFKDWERVLAVVKRVVLTAWRPALTMALLGQLAELDVLEDGSPSSRSIQPPAANPGQTQRFEKWVQQERGAASLEELLEQQRASPSGNDHPGRAAEVAKGNAPRGSGHQRPSGSRQRPVLAGSKHAVVLSSLPLRFGQVAAAAPEVPPALLDQQPEAADVPPAVCKRVRLAAAPQVIQASPEQDTASAGATAWEAMWSQPCPCEREASEAGSSQNSFGDAMDDAQPTAFAGQHAPLAFSDSWQQFESASLVAAGLGSPGAEDQQPPSQLPSFLGSPDYGMPESCCGGQWHGAGGHARPSGGLCDQNEQEYEEDAAGGLTADEQRLLDQAAEQPVERRQRPKSAPPQAKQHKRTVHTNPMQSLHVAAAGRQHARQGVRGLDTVSGLGWRQQKPAVERMKGGATLECNGNNGGVGPVRRGLQPRPAGYQSAASPAAEAAAVSEKAEEAQEQAAAAALAVRVVDMPHSAAPGGPQGSPAGISPTPETAVPAAVQPTATAAPSFLQPAAGLDVLLSSWRNPVMQSAAAVGEDVVSLEALTSSCFAQLKPPALSRPELQGAVALQQLDKKFIPLVTGSLVALVDQHAAGAEEHFAARAHRYLSFTCGPLGLLSCLGGRGRCSRLH